MKHIPCSQALLARWIDFHAVRDRLDAYPIKRFSELVTKATFCIGALFGTLPMIFFSKVTGVNHKIKFPAPIGFTPSLPHVHTKTSDPPAGIAQGSSVLSGQ